jgi:hypothetical protein
MIFPEEWMTPTDARQTMNRPVALVSWIFLVHARRRQVVLADHAQ